MSFVNIPCVALKGSKKNQDAVVGVHGHTSQYNPSVTENTYICVNSSFMQSGQNVNSMDVKSLMQRPNYNKAMYGECGTDKGFRNSRVLLCSKFDSYNRKQLVSVLLYGEHPYDFDRYPYNKLLFKAVQNFLVKTKRLRFKSVLQLT